MNSVSIIIPWRSNGDTRREANLTAVLDHLTDTDLPIILSSDGRESGSPFNRSAAYNAGMRLAPAEVYIFCEGDMLVPLDQLHDAIDVAAQSLGLVVPFTEYRYHDEVASRRIINGTDPADLSPQRVMPDGAAVGAVGVVSHESMRWVGQWDETFSGHGYDDRAMYLAFHTACGPATFIDGPADHLWHPPAYSPWERNSAASTPENYAMEERAATYANKVRLRHYKRALTPEDVRELTGAPW